MSRPGWLGGQRACMCALRGARARASGRARGAHWQGAAAEARRAATAVVGRARACRGRCAVAGQQLAAICSAAFRRFEEAIDSIYAGLVMCD